MADQTLSISASGVRVPDDTASTDSSSAHAKTTSRRLHTVIRALSPVAVLVIWQVGSALGIIPQDRLPAPSLIAEAGWEVLSNGQLVDAIAASAQRVAIGLTIGVLIVAEQIAATSGLGYLINNARDFLRTDIIFFGLIVYAALGLITDAIVRALERHTTRYQNR